MALARLPQGLQCSLAEVMAEELPEVRGQLREGQDFRELHEATALLAEVEPAVVRAPQWALVTMRVLRELWLQEMTGGFGLGGAFSTQPAWRVELWEAYWRARGGRVRRDG